MSALTLSDVHACISVLKPQGIDKNNRRAFVDFITSIVSAFGLDPQSTLTSEWLSPDTYSLEIPRKWGAPVWRVIFALPDHVTDRKTCECACSIISSLQYLLPCPKCRAHLTNYIAHHPLQFNASAKQIQEWVLKYYDDVRANQK